MRAQVAASLRRTADGVPYIEPTEALREKAAQNPHLKYAVFDLTQTMAFQGSSPELVGQLRKMGEIKAFLMNFTFEGAPDSDLRGALTKVDTSAGRVIIVTYGYQFHWDDLIYFFRDNAWDNFIFSFPSPRPPPRSPGSRPRRTLASARRRCTRVAHRHEFDRPTHSVEGIPAETMPLVEAVNAALARLDAGAARQRRFAANAAHELRTPVAILRTRIDALSDVPYKTNLKRDVRRIQTIVDQLLIAARLNEHGGDDGRYCRSCHNDPHGSCGLRPARCRKQEHIEFESPVPSVQVRGNRQALECIAANLIDNALRAEPEGKSVLVRVGPGGTVDVVDHGAGIPKGFRAIEFLNHSGGAARPRPERG